MGYDSPDGSAFDSQLGYVDLLTQRGVPRVFSYYSNVAAGAEWHDGLLNSETAYLYRVCGIRLASLDGTKFRADIYSDTVNFGYYNVVDQIDIWYPDSVYISIPYLSYFKANLKNNDASTRMLQIYITTMRYNKPCGWVLRPSANFTVSDSTPNAGDTVSFNESSLYEPITFFWDFGDGHSSSVREPTHIYTIAGTYVAVLTVSNAGGIDTKTMTIVVS